jgi:iron complex transport system ATP-binding protein
VDQEVLWKSCAELPSIPGRGVYVWVAGESGMVRAVRRYLVGEVGLDRTQVAFMGYWRQGSPETG